MYAIFEELCNSCDVTPYRVGKETGIATSTFSDWKNGKSTPKTDKLQKIADFFNVSLEYLMTGKEIDSEEKYGLEMDYMVAKIRNDIELSKALLKYFELSDVKKKHVVELINLLGEVSA